MKKRWHKLYGMDTTIICPYCLRPTPIQDTNIDHIIPKSRGGKNSDENKVRCCKACNSEKGSLSPEEYAEWKRLEFIRNGGLNQGNHR